MSQYPSTARGMTRRQLLASGAACGSLIVGAGFIAHPTAAWAMETKALTPEQMATLVQMARDIYPHDKVADKFYAIAVKDHDEKASGDEAHKMLISDGLADLDSRAGEGGYVGTGWEADRVALLRQIEDTAFFQAVRGGLVVGLYNQSEVWPIFGYEGPSYEHGGYINRGFDDIDWV